MRMALVIRSTADLVKVLADALQELRKSNASKSASHVQTLQHLSQVLSETDSDHFIITSKQEQTGNYEGTFVRFFEQIYHFGHVPSFPQREDMGFDEEDFGGCSERATIVMTLMLIFLTKMQTTSLPEETVAKILQNLIPKALILCGEHCEPRPWTSQESVQKSVELEKGLLSATKCGSMADILTNPTDGSWLPRGQLCVVFEDIKVRFTAHTWRHHASLPAVVWWMLHHVGSSHMDDVIGLVLPPSLLMLDDYKVANKVLGVRCLQHMLTNCTAAQLKWYGEDAVIHEALQRQMYHHQVELLDVLLPCIARSLHVTESDPQKTDSPRRDNRYDVILERLLPDMEMENLVAVRRVYCRHVHRFLQPMGITLVGHLTHILKMCSSYLEIWDGPEEICRINILTALRQVIRQAWPRIPHHCGQIIKMLTRLLYDMLTDRTSTSDAVKRDVIDKAVECLVWTKRAAPAETNEILNQLSELSLTPEWNQTIAIVLHDTGSNLA